MRARSWLVGISCTLCGAGLALAQGNPDALPDSARAPHASSGPATSTVRANDSDQEPILSEGELLNLLHRSNRTQIEAAQMAARRGRSAPVRRYAQFIVRDQSRADAELQRVAAQTGVTLQDPGEPPLDPIRRTWNPAEVDRRFLNVMAHDQDETISAVEAAKNTTQTPAVQAYLAKELPKMHEHERTTLRQLSNYPF